MPQITWYQAVELIQPHVFRISTPGGSGTGFLISHAPGIGGLCTIATAAHVLSHAHNWEEPIRIHHVHSGKSVLLHYRDRGILLDQDRDTAAVIMLKGDLPLPDDRLPLAPQGKFLRVGNEIGWLGFPAISEATLCFFSGRVSAALKDRDAYLVDGVAIHGVSGGPAFYLPDANYPPIMVVGVVSAYVRNVAAGETLPGMAMVQNVEQFHMLAQDFASLDQAMAKQSPPTTRSPQS